MPPPRPFSRDDRNVRRTRVNHLIRITPIRLIGPNEEMIGVIETQEALRMADQAGMDLVEISPDARPPVCRIMDYGKFKYEQSKKEQASRAASKVTEMKEVRLGRSVKIDPHDVQIRVDQSRRFLMAGHKVMLTQKFRGREIAHKDIGLTRLREICDSLADVSKLEQTPRFMGKQASIILAPDKVKIEAIKRRLAKEKAAKEGISEEAALKAHEEENKKVLAAAEAAGVGAGDDDGDDDEE
ncbi:MAG: translation initiation factor IF-3 [Phycisphaerales bacterium]|nr:translation initiation factor IF-3 [Phycisphaerales bacterium]